ncbi:ABC-type sugar transport system permease subunit [Paenibacillus rhizosphaerae]|uniref:ABC-type sugar transport system permease subunit n=1 Tax=Paenibacillus rhizosphaerae TaxID=297318 RepID=A0A839TNT9_9BACL|nr:hypothetical protein [Paenibacillus rhizosphaerae]MBB3128466.1 ABC-type sugar transport system permease subunit [Paenibacillus rhizosphaerae]
MLPFVLSLFITIVLFVYFVNKQRPKKELILYSVMSLLGIVQFLLLIIDKPIQLPAIMAELIDRLM